MPIRGCWQEQRACELQGSKLYMKLRGSFRTPALGVRADSCSLSFWNNQLKTVGFFWFGFFFFFFQSRKTYGISFPWDTLRALLRNRVNFPKIFSPKADISFSTSSNHMTIPFLSDNQMWDPSYPWASPFTTFFFAPLSQTRELPKTEESCKWTAWREGGDS